MINNSKEYEEEIERDKIVETIGVAKNRLAHRLLNTNPFDTG